jgi:hypothetical protein
MIDAIGQRTDHSLARSAAPSIRPLIEAKVLARLLQVWPWLLVPWTLSLAITRQSLWPDEAMTAWFVAHTGFKSFFWNMVGSPGAAGDSQIIFYLLYMWGWVKLFGQSEFALRAANIPFAILYIGAAAWVSRHLLKHSNLWVFFCLNPFFWFYLNEARPYIAFLAFSTLATVALLAYLLNPVQYKTLAPWSCLIALFFAWASHIMAAFLFASFVVIAALSVFTKPTMPRAFFKDWAKPTLLCAPAFVALAAFYIRTSANGTNRFGKPSLSSLLYALYEFTGFAGLGPPRNDIRANPHLHVFSSYWPLLLLGLVPLVGIGILLLRTRPSKLVLSLAAGLLIGVAVAAQVAVLAEFQLLGRHLTALLPLLFLTLMLWLAPSLAAVRPVRYAAIVVLIALAITWSISDVRLATMAKYQKDSYREASSITLKAVRPGQHQLLWAADPYSAYYYGIRVMKGPRPGGIGVPSAVNWPVIQQAVDARNWSFDQASAYISASKVPIVLALGKSDAFDANSAWLTLLQERKPSELARLNTLAIYEWRPPDAPMRASQISPTP